MSQRIMLNAEEIDAARAELGHPGTRAEGIASVAMQALSELVAAPGIYEVLTDHDGSTLITRWAEVAEIIEPRPEVVDCKGCDGSGIEQRGVHYVPCRHCGGTGKVVTNG